MIQSVRIQNFRGHTDTTIPLERFTLLVGENGVGKTSAMEAMHLLPQMIGTNPSALFVSSHAVDRLVRSGSVGGLAVLFDGVDDGREWQLGLAMRAHEKTSSVMEACVEWRVGEKVGKVAAPGPKFDDLFGIIREVPRIVMRSREAMFLRLDASVLARPERTEEERPRLDERGGGLANVIATMLLQDRPRFERLLAAASAVIPSLRDIQVRRVPVDRRIERLMIVDGQSVIVPELTKVIADQVELRFDGTEWLPADAASEGTLLTLGLLTVLHQERVPKVVYIDDIDRGLHPYAQEKFIAQLRAVQAAVGDVQIVATTHSPYLVDAFEPEEVVVLARDKDRVVHARRLSDHPNKKPLEVLRTGEFWGAEGEAWVVP